LKFKYYLRGIGLGILFATLLMTAAIYYHGNSISDQEIIERAQGLGMVMSSEQETDDAEATETADDWADDWLDEP
jgi:hypothetical protein